VWRGAFAPAVVPPELVGRTTLAVH
jgi:hypothetical protein